MTTTKIRSAHDVTRRRLDASSSVRECERVRRRALKNADRSAERMPHIAEEWRRLAGYAMRRNAEIRRANK